MHTKPNNKKNEKHKKNKTEKHFLNNVCQRESERGREKQGKREIEIGSDRKKNLNDQLRSQTLY